MADQIIAYANSGVQPADVVAGVPHMAEKVADGSLEATLMGFVNVAPEKGSFYGSGTFYHQCQPGRGALCGLPRHCLTR